LQKHNGISKENMDLAEARIVRVFEAVDKLLMERNSTNSTDLFLLGTNRPTAADFAFASLSATVLFPKETEKYFSSLPTLSSGFPRH